MSSSIVSLIVTTIISILSIGIGLILLFLADTVGYYKVCKQELEERNETLIKIINNSNYPIEPIPPRRKLIYQSIFINKEILGEKNYE